MEFFNRSNPAYKSATSAKQAAARPTATSWFSNLFGSLFGSAPAYRTVDGQRISAPSSSGLWSLLGAASPAYKAVPAAPIDAEASLDVDGLLGGCESLAADAVGADVALDEVPACAGPDQIVIL